MKQGFISGPDWRVTTSVADWQSAPGADGMTSRSRILETSGTDIHQQCGQNSTVVTLSPGKDGGFMFLFYTQH